jgi:uncharacterized lipoprotein YmbA
MTPICKTTLSLLLSILIVALVGCSSPAPEPTLYLLRGAPAEGGGQITAEVRVGLGRVVIAPYLTASQGIVVETEPGQIRPARQHRWAEPLEFGIRWFVRTEIARALGYEIGGGLVDTLDWDFTVDLYVSRFHGTIEGTAMLQAAFVIRSAADRSISEYRFARSAPLADSGYPALVAAEQKLLHELSDEIATALRARITTD